MKHNKVAIVGLIGSGKTTISKKMSNILSLPVFHVDNIVWGQDWADIEKNVYLDNHNEILKRDKWIIEGYIDTDMKHRLEVADLIIYLDYPVWFSLQRFLRRYFKRWFNFIIRNGMEEPEDKSIVFLLKTIVEKIMRKEKRDLEDLLGEKNLSSKLVRVKNSKMLALFLEIEFQILKRS